MKDLANTIKKIVEYKGEIIWDTNRPNGQPRRCLEVSRARDAFGFQANITLPFGLEATYRWYLENYERIEAPAQVSHRPQAAL